MKVIFAAVGVGILLALSLLLLTPKQNTGCQKEFIVQYLY